MAEGEGTYSFHFADGDWRALKRLLRKLGMQLGPGASPPFHSLTLTGLTASRLIWGDSNKLLASKDLVDLIVGTANRVTVTDDAAGGVTLSGPQDLGTSNSPTFSGLTLTSLNAVCHDNEVVCHDNEIVFV